MAGSSLDCTKPLLMSSFTDKWPCRSWTFTTLADLLKDKKFSCRVAPKSCGRKMETECSHHDVTIKEFCDWLDGRANDSSPLSGFSREYNSCYIDYKHMKDMFQEQPEVFETVQWKDFGLVGFTGYDSTIWISSEGANTPGHQDTYGFNLITQIYGRKVWILFPPEDSQYLYPTRVPYEESSIFSEVNFRNPNLRCHSQFKLSHPHVVTLQPGQTLFVPRHWWHYVESLEPSISINVWVPLRQDKESRISEAVTRCLASGLISSLDTSSTGFMQSVWLNPTESLAPAAMNLLLLKTALCQLLEDVCVGEHSVRSDGKQSAQDGLLCSHELIQQGDLQRRVIQSDGASKTGDNSEPQSHPTVCYNIKTCEDVQEDVDSGINNVISSTDYAGQSEMTSDVSMLSLFAEKMRGFLMCQVDSPFQCNFDARLPMKRSINSLDTFSKKVKLDLALTKELGNSEDKHRKLSSPRVISLTSCSFEIYVKLLKNLCRQSQCRHCDTDNMTVNSPGENHFSVSTRIGSLGAFQHRGHEPSEGTLETPNICFLDNACSSGSNSVLDHQKRRASIEFNDEEYSLTDRNCFGKEKDSTLGDDKIDESTCSGSFVARDFCQLGQQEISETLLRCTLHPDVVKVISRLFLKKYQRELKHD